MIEFGSANKYLINTSNPGFNEDWTTEVFPAESGWSNGSYGIGYDTSTGANALNLINTVVPSGPSGNYPLTVYTRANFTITDINAVSNVTLGADYDDAYAAWINGVEVFRSAELAAVGALDWNTTPTLHESSNGVLPDYFPLSDITSTALSAMHNGTNVLAVGVWNGSITSSDLVLVPNLSINSPLQVERGPYLQSGTATSIVIKWRTSIATDSKVQYGSAPDNLTNVVNSSVLTTNHEVEVNGLIANTKYYYDIGTNTQVLASDDVSYFFVTSPAISTSKPTRIWVLGDSGTGNADAQVVADSYTNFTDSTHTDLWMMLGDNAYDDGTDSEYQSAVFEIYPEMLRKSVLWSTMGNHDGRSADSTTQSGPYYDIFTFPTAGEVGGLASGTEAYYSFDYGNIHFICLDSQETDRSVDGAMLTWATADIAATTAEWVIAFWHHPPYSKGSHDSDTELQLFEMRRNALPILEAAGVDLVLSGHSHSYERSLLVEGHYFSSNTLNSSMKIDAGDGQVSGDGAYKAVYDEVNPYQGTVYVTAGSSGKISGGALNHPVMIHASLNLLGSMVLDINGNRLDATFVQSDGSTPDTFTILKAPDNCPLITNPSQLDTDSDAMGDVCDLDDDNDGLSDTEEQGYGTNPLLVDTDGDGFSDNTEIIFGSDPLNSASLPPVSIPLFGFTSYIILVLSLYLLGRQHLTLRR